MTSPLTLATLGQMVILTLAFSTDGPELSHEEIERQIAEFEREFEHQRNQNTRMQSP